MRTPIRLLAAASVLAASTAAACPACYSGKDSAASAGMNWAILAMLGITGVVFGLIVAAALYFRRRARAHSAALSASLFVNEQGQLSTTNAKGIPEWNNS